MSASLPDRIELDGAVELLRCPRFSRGWSAGEIRIAHSPDLWLLPREYGALREEWERRHPGERSDPKVAIREVRIDQDQTLVCRLQDTAWREVRPLHEGPKLEQGALLRCRSDVCEMLLPNMGVVHVVAGTRDGWILAFRRSERSHYHPGFWSATYEEGFAPEDIGDHAVFQRAARRGLAEELTEHAHAVELDAFHIVSVVLEQPLGNPAVVVMADLPFSRAELSAQGPSDELDASSLVPIPIDEAHLRGILASPTCALNQAGNWHPTARYRILVAIAHFFGEGAAAEALARTTG